MPRLTITLSDERHRQLRMRAAYQGKSIGQIIEETMTEAEAAARVRITEIMEKAWAHADKVRPDATEEEVMDFALELEREVNEEYRAKPQNG